MFNRELFSKLQAESHSADADNIHYASYYDTINAQEIALCFV